MTSNELLIGSLYSVFDPATGYTCVWHGGLTVFVLGDSGNPVGSWLVPCADLGARQATEDEVKASIQLKRDRKFDGVLQSQRG